MFVVDTTLKNRKDELLAYFRSRIAESSDEIQKIQGTHKYREQATAVNKAIAGIRNTLISALTQTATREEWPKVDILECVLIVTYVSYVVMIETRNGVWPYDYMSFSRRVGELNCLLLVRAEEDKNNAYFQILKNSGIWKAYCGAEAYARIKEYSGFDIKRWINQNANWQGDFLPEAKQHIEKNNLDHYLAW